MNKLSVNLTKEAERQIKRMNEPLKSRVIKRIYGYPYPNIVKLGGYDNKYRTRLGDWRIVFSKYPQSILIEKVMTRGQVYKED